MTAFGFNALSMAWLAALAVPLVLFYFLKLKRTRLRVSSLALWQQVIHDRRVNSPFQKFKRHLLLLLQLLVLLAVVLAATQPFWRGATSRSRRLLVLIDCSASMGALDRPGGVSRLDAAKEKVNDIIDVMLDDQEACILSFGASARRRCDFTNNRKVLRDALRGIEVEDVASDLEGVLRMAQGLGRSAPLEEVLLFSDGNFPTEIDFELPFELSYHRLTPAGANLGITSLSARRTPERMWDVFVRVEGTGGTQTTSTAVEVICAGETVATENVSLTAGHSERLVFRLPGETASSVEVRLVPDGFDSLVVDNRALLDLPAVRPLNVYAATSLASFRHALRAVPGIVLSPDPAGRSAGEPYDLVVTDRADEVSLAGRTCLYVGIVPEAVSALVTFGKEGTSVIDWRRNCALLQHVELRDLIVLDDVRSADEVDTSDFEDRGYEVLVHGGRGPLVLSRTEPGKLSYHTLFHTDRSTLPYRIGFPILVSNLVQDAAQQAGLSEARAHRTGVLPPLALEPERVYRIVGPEGEPRSEKSGVDGTLSGVPAPRVGRYVITEDGTERASLGASLLSETETSLEGVEEIRFSEDIAVGVASAALPRDRSLWPMLALVALALLCAEWLYYHRSPGWFAK